MDELSLYVLDITMNAVRAGATEISVLLAEDGNILRFSVTDNGCGMTKEQIERIKDPFFTTRKTRKVGLGIPFLTMLAEGTGGSVTLTSKTKDEGADHGTKIEAVFHRDHVDFIPLGDMTETVKTLIQGSPDIRFIYKHVTDAGEVFLDTAELSAVLGGISLAEPEILAFIDGDLREQYRDLGR